MLWVQRNLKNLTVALVLLGFLEGCAEGTDDTNSNDGTLTYEDCASVTGQVAELLGCNDLFCAPGAKRCSGNIVQECFGDSIKNSLWVDSESCSGTCSNGSCTDTGNNGNNGNNGGSQSGNSGCKISCRTGLKTCFHNPDKGNNNTLHTLKECRMGTDNCPYWETIQECDTVCSPEFGKCFDGLPACKFTNNIKATILQWTDGDTLWVRAKSDGNCNDHEYSAEQSDWQNIRYDIRVHGIDAPECSKQQNKYRYFTCVQNTTYYTTNNQNEPYGYEAWVEAEKMLPYESEVLLSCDKTNTDGTCVFDRTEDRYLAYIGFTQNNASYDFSTELTRKGLAFSLTKFDSSKRSDICKAQKEAMNAQRNIWSLADHTVSGVSAKFGPSKKNWLKYMEKRCNDAMK